MNKKVMVEGVLLEIRELIYEVDSSYELPRDYGMDPVIRQSVVLANRDCLQLLCEMIGCVWFQDGDSHWVIGREKNVGTVLRYYRQIGEQDCPYLEVGYYRDAEYELPVEWRASWLNRDRAQARIAAYKIAEVIQRHWPEREVSLPVPQCDQHNVPKGWWAYAQNASE